MHPQASAASGWLPAPVHLCLWSALLSAASAPPQLGLVLPHPPLLSMPVQAPPVQTAPPAAVPHQRPDLCPASLLARSCLSSGAQLPGPSLESPRLPTALPLPLPLPASPRPAPSSPPLPCAPCPPPAPLSWMSSRAAQMVVTSRSAIGLFSPASRPTASSTQLRATAPSSLPACALRTTAAETWLPRPGHTVRPASVPVPLARARASQPPPAPPLHAEPSAVLVPPLSVATGAGPDRVVASAATSFHAAP